MHRLRMQRGIPLGDGGVQRGLIQAHVRAGLEGVARKLIADGDERAVVQKGMGHAVHHVGGPGAARGKAYPGCAGEFAPGRSNHGTGRLLLHQVEGHAAPVRRLDDVQRPLLARHAGDEAGASLAQ